MIDGVDLESGIGQAEVLPVTETLPQVRLTTEQRKDFESKGCVIVSLPTKPEGDTETFKRNALGILLEHVGGVATDDEIEEMVEMWPSGFDVAIPPDQISGVNF